MPLPLFLEPEDLDNKSGWAVESEVGYFLTP